MSSDEEPPVTMRRAERHVAWVTLNRPARGNAVDKALAHSMADIVRGIEADPEWRVAVLTGAGRFFCTGADLSEVAACGHRDLSTPDGGFAGFAAGQRKKPWIAAVGGAAVGGGFEIVLACDMAVASGSAYFGLPEVRRGLVASAGGVARLPRRVPRAVALEMIATGAFISSARAYELGLVNRVVADDRLEAEALGLAAAIAANSPLAVREALAIGRSSFDLSEAELLQLSRQASDRVRASPDAIEGPRAFIEKRDPHWRT